MTIQLHPLVKANYTLNPDNYTRKKIKITLHEVNQQLAQLNASVSVHCHLPFSLPLMN